MPLAGTKSDFTKSHKLFKIFYVQKISTNRKKIIQIKFCTDEFNITSAMFNKSPHLCPKLLGCKRKQSTELLYIYIHVVLVCWLTSSECVEAPQPPLSEEPVSLLCWVLAVISTWSTEVGQHGPVVLPLCCLLPVLLLVIPGDIFNKARLIFYTVVGSHVPRSNDLHRH